MASREKEGLHKLRALDEAKRLAEKKRNDECKAHAERTAELLRQRYGIAED
jgi:HEPN domain-containing protein